AKMKTVTITTVVVDCTSARDGVTTLRISLRTSFRKLRVRSGSDLICWIPVPVCCSATATVLAITLPLIFLLLTSTAAACGLGRMAGELGFEPKFGFGDRQFNR